MHRADLETSMISRHHRREIAISHSFTPIVY
jgi:hypothetical protein